MDKGSWRDRLSDAIARSGRSERSLSIAIGRADGYVHGILKAGKEPGIDSFAALARELNVSLPWLLFGAEMSGNTERLLEVYAALSPSQQADFLRLAENLAGVLAPKTAQ